MDLSVLPNIVALAVLLVAYRPLVRRVGAHANLWFAGWMLVLLHWLVLMFSSVQQENHGWTAWVSLGTMEGCGLMFLLASANARTVRINRAFALELWAAMLVQCGLATLGVQWGIPHVFSTLANLMFLMPVLDMVLRHGSREPLKRHVALGFALLGLLTITLAAQRPLLVTHGVLACIFVSAAYAWFTHASHMTRGVLVTGAGLAGWGFSFPLSLLVQHFWPALQIPMPVMELPIYVVVSGSVLTLLEEHVLRTERLATHDALTDLPNRRLLEDHFMAAMEEARRARTTLACLVIDVDDFKRINDTMGHKVGDELLRALAIRLSWHMSPRDMLARTGGDEFTAMLAGVTDEHHLRFIASAMVSAASVPVMVDGKAVNVRISIGIALSPDDADEMTELYRLADEAMYRAKRRGGNILVFAGEDSQPAEEAGLIGRLSELVNTRGIRGEEEARKKAKVPAATAQVLQMAGRTAARERP